MTQDSLEQAIELAQHLQGAWRRRHGFFAAITAHAGRYRDQLEALQPMNQFAAATRTPEAHLLIQMDQLGDRDRLVLGDQENRGCEAY